MVEDHGRTKVTPQYIFIQSLVAISDFGALLLRKKKAEKNARISLNESEKKHLAAGTVSSFEMVDFVDFL